jgi:CRP/FNR family transcriptional regulator, cyclic AMP receptor protein
MASSRMDDKIKALSTVGLFSGCSKKELQSVARLCTPLSMEEGFVLTTEGTPGRECFVIADGKAGVTIGGKKVGEVGRGECVGEMALLDGGPRTATVTAESPMNTYALSVSEFWSLLDVNPTILRKIATSLAQRLRALEAHYPH